MEEENRDRLRDFLQKRRARVSPSDLDLPSRRYSSGRGRRAPGLSQDQMAHAVGCSPKLYARLERGLLEDPDEEFVRDVASVLRLDEEEWRTLWSYLGRSTSLRPLNTRLDQKVLESWQRNVLDRCDSMAYITTPEWEYLAGNESFAEMFESGEPPSNTLEYMLSEEGRRTLADWENAWAPSFLAQLCGAIAADSSNPTLRRLVAMVREDPVARSIFEGDLPSRTLPEGDVRPLLHPKLGPGCARLNAAVLPSGERLVFVHFTPG